MPSPVFASSSAVVGVAPSSSNTIAPPSGTAADNFLLMVCAGGTCTSSGWTLGPSLAFDAPNNANSLRMLYKIATGSEPANYTVSNSDGTRLSAVYILRYTGNVTTSFIVGSGTEDTPFVSPFEQIELADVGTSAADSTYIAAYLEGQERNSRNVTANAPMTMRYQFDDGAAGRVTGALDEALTGSGGVSGRTAKGGAGLGGWWRSVAIVLQGTASGGGGGHVRKILQLMGG